MRRIFLFLLEFSVELKVKNGRDECERKTGKGWKKEMRMVGISSGSSCGRLKYMSS